MTNLLNFDVNWFCSEKGQTAFSSLSSAEDRSVFLYSYLRQLAKPEFETEQVLFKTAFFLADAIFGSSLPYSAYPALVDPSRNPFVAYLKNASRFPGATAVYCIFLSILHGLAEPARLNEWVYEEQLSDGDYLEKKLVELGKRFYADSIGMADPDAFIIEEALQPVQLKLIWLMGPQEARR